MAAELQASLNRLAGTTGLDAQGAANVWAGTTGLDLLGALNVKAGTVGVGLNRVCNLLAGTTGLDAQGALSLATSFGPVTSVGWTAAYWAGGPEFAALGLADGAAVSSWPDEKATNNLAQATGTKQPAYRATGGANSKPALQFDGNDLISLNAAPTVTHPFTVVVIAKLGATSAGQKELLVGDSSNGALYQASTGWRMYNGTVLAGGASDTNWHLFVAYFNGASSVLEIDGASNASGNAETNNMAGVYVCGGGTTGTWDGYVAFAATHDSDARADGGWAGFETWVGTEYGITVA